MRIVGLSLLALVLTGTALTLSGGTHQPIVPPRLLDVLPKPDMVFEPGREERAGRRGTEVAFRRTAEEAPLILSGLPAYGSAQYVLPVTARPLEGYLQLETTIQVLDGTRSALRVSIDGARRGEVQLAPGVITPSLRIPLTADDLAKPALNVSFSITGSGPAGSCTDEDQTAVVAEIEAESRLVLALDGPLTTAADRLASAGNVARIGWTETLTEEERAARLMRAAALKRGGAAVSFIAGKGLSNEDLLALVADMPRAASDVAAAQSFPARFDEISGSRGAQSFQRSTTWRARYALDDRAGSETAGRLDLGLALGPLPDGARWMVSATLNGRLLMAESLERGARVFSATLDLPHEVQGSSNLVEITAASDQTLTGLCNNGPELIAELTDATMLQGSGRSLSAPLEELHAEIRAQGQVSLAAVGPMTGPDAAAFAGLIAAAVPADVTTESGAGALRIEPLRRADVAGLAASGRADEQAWIVHAMADGGVAALRATPEAIETLAAEAPLALLVRAQPMSTAGLFQ